MVFRYTFYYADENWYFSVGIKKVIKSLVQNGLGCEAKKSRNTEERDNKMPVDDVYCGDELRGGSKRGNCTIISTINSSVISIRTEVISMVSVLSEVSRGKY